MKSLLSILVMIICISCQKEITKPDTPNANIQSVSGANSKPIVVGAKTTYSIDAIASNLCTGENMHITGLINYNVHYVIKDTSVHFSYEVHYDGLIGTGLISGKKYQGSGHIIDNFTGTAVLVYDQYLGDVYLLSPTNETILNKVMFTSPGGGNNLFQNLSYRLRITNDGTLIENTDWKEAYCQ